AGDRERQADILGDVQERDKVKELEDEPGAVAPEPGRRLVSEAADHLALEDHLAARRPVEPAEQLEERALARSRRAHEGDELALLDRQGDAAQRLDRRFAQSIALREVAGLEDRRHGRSVSTTAGPSGTLGARGLLGGPRPFGDARALGGPRPSTAPAPAARALGGRLLVANFAPT